MGKTRDIHPLITVETKKQKDTSNPPPCFRTSFGLHKWFKQRKNKEKKIQQQRTKEEGGGGGKSITSQHYPVSFHPSPLILLALFLLSFINMKMLFQITKFL